MYFHTYLELISDSVQINKFDCFNDLIFKKWKHVLFRQVQVIIPRNMLPS